MARIETADKVSVSFFTYRCFKREQRMSAKVDTDIAANARAKLERLQKSSKYHSFFNVDAIDAFSKVEGAAFAGVPLKRTKAFDDPSSRG